MLYSLPNGGVINISLEEYFNMSDEDFDEFTKCISEEDCTEFYSLIEDDEKPIEEVL
jgi:hypothetical protein